MFATGARDFTCCGSTAVDAAVDFCVCDALCLCEQVVEHAGLHAVESYHGGRGCSLLRLQPRRVDARCRIVGWFLPCAQNQVRVKLRDSSFFIRR